KQFLDGPGITVHGTGAKVGYFLLVLRRSLQVLEPVERSLVANAGQSVIHWTRRPLRQLTIQPVLNQFRQSRQRTIVILPADRPKDRWIRPIAGTDGPGLLDQV